MAASSAVVRGVRTLGTREFWTFRAIHSVLGAILTILGACGGIFVTEQLRKDMSAIEGQVAEKSERIGSIERALAQFQLLQSQGVLLGVMANNESMRTEFRLSFMQFGLWVRKPPTTRMLHEQHSENPAAFQAAMAEHLKLFEAALPATDKATWDALLAFEMQAESKVRDLQDKLTEERAALIERRRVLDGWRNTATLWGFILQQLGFVIVLLAGLIYQHETKTLVAPAVHPAER